MSDAPCRCHCPPFHFADYITIENGEDKTNGRYGEVTVQTCKLCGTHWLRYFVEYEHRSGSGRWYRGVIEAHLIDKIRPEDAVRHLESLPTYFYGGNYFGSTGREGRGQVFVDA